MISGFDKKPHMVLADMAAMQRIRDRIARSEASERAEDKAASERAALVQSQNGKIPVPGSEEKIGLSPVIGNSSRFERDKMLMP